MSGIPADEVRHALEAEAGLSEDMIVPRDPTPQEERDSLEAEHAREIDRHRDGLLDGVASLNEAVTSALYAARELCSDQVYDVEMAEGRDGAAIVALLAALEPQAVALAALVEKVTR